MDKPDPTQPDKDAYNPYRYTAKRWDQVTGSYDMGFRDYNPGLNRFLTRDTYTGALDDLNLGTDPYTGNRYAFTGGNPITGSNWTATSPAAPNAAPTASAAASPTSPAPRTTQRCRHPRPTTGPTWCNAASPVGYGMPAPAQSTPAQTGSTTTPAR